MPLYGYACLDHGEFEAFASAAQCSEQRPCPLCERMSPRSFTANAGVGVISDTALFTSDRLDQLPGAKDGTYIGEVYRRKAEKAGVVTRGKQYIGGLAMYPGDPEAWVDSRSDMMRIAKKNNLHVDGIVKHKAEQAPPPPKGVCETIVNRYVAEQQAANPTLTRERAVEDFMNKHAPRGAKQILKKPSRKFKQRGKHAGARGSR